MSPGRPVSHGAPSDSVRVPLRLIEDREVPHVAFRVYAVLAAHCREGRVRRLTEGQIATKTGVSTKTVQRAIAELEAQGYVVIVPPGHNQANLYILPDFAPEGAGSRDREGRLIKPRATSPGRTPVSPPSVDRTEVSSPIVDGAPMSTPSVSGVDGEGQAFPSREKPVPPSTSPEKDRTPQTAPAEEDRWQARRLPLSPVLEELLRVGKFEQGERMIVRLPREDDQPELVYFIILCRREGLVECSPDEPLHEFVERALRERPLDNPEFGSRLRSNIAARLGKPGPSDAPAMNPAALELELLDACFGADAAKGDGDA